MHHRHCDVRATKLIPCRDMLIYSTSHDTPHYFRLQDRLRVRCYSKSSQSGLGKAL